MIATEIATTEEDPEAAAAATIVIDITAVAAAVAVAAATITVTAATPTLATPRAIVIAEAVVMILALPAAAKHGMLVFRIEQRCLVCLFHSFPVSSVLPWYAPCWTLHPL